MSGLAVVEGLKHARQPLQTGLHAGGTTAKSAKSGAALASGIGRLADLNQHPARKRGCKQRGSAGERPALMGLMV